MSLAGFRYHAGRWLALEAVEVSIREGLVEISHRGVLVATHARRHKPGKEPKVLQERAPRQAPRPNAKSVTRKVDNHGSVSFAGASYRVGNPYRRQSAQVSLAGDTVQIRVDGRLIRTHPIRHDRAKEHGAFATPGGRPRRINAA